MKKLVEVKNLQDHICPVTHKVYADGTIILTPGAKDELCKRGIPVVYGPNPNAAACADTASACDDEGKEKLFYAVAAVLKEDYGVNDMETLKDLSCRIVDAIDGSI